LALTQRRDGWIRRCGRAIPPHHLASFWIERLAITSKLRRLITK
jgi:hypothetical protein